MFADDIYAKIFWVIKNKVQHYRMTWSYFKDSHSSGILIFLNANTFTLVQRTTMAITTYLNGILIDITTTYRDLCISLMTGLDFIASQLKLLLKLTKFLNWLEGYQFSNNNYVRGVGTCNLS